MKKVAIIGSSGAIGNAISKQLIEDKDIELIYRFSRTKNEISSDFRIKDIFIDIEDEDSIKTAVKAIPESIKFDLVFVATGMLHDDDNIFPEKSIKDIEHKKLHKILSVNIIGPTLVGKYFIPYLAKDKKSVFAFLSARVGSISDNKLGGWYAYRSSKAALNQIIKNFSIEIKRTNPTAIFVGLQPGTVKSFLSKPFEKNVRSDKLFSPEYSAKNLINLIKNLTPNESGKLLAWDGEEIQP
ncbi:MAG: short-chain dehydrogenase [Gammaproteobacteria bacterium]|nr:short-chain dehydrogenase [Gammaproteobacteria bacterium]|tara:strand:+ start:404 stop:1126 length:723 start_codon:yes stop_codon:yes gene_type:complete